MSGQDGPMGDRGADADITSGVLTRSADGSKMHFASAGEGAVALEALLSWLEAHYPSFLDPCGRQV
ncbi:hypothetical protein AB0K60_02150 [Thermopolyspora sp. NPDC052614]|uniref:hypothetical protein n=1 Tax=Thermopolyspora sp. NPDC052614 TaxID=3155682 RepID=UPI00343626E1